VSYLELVFDFRTAVQVLAQYVYVALLRQIAGYPRMQRRSRKEAEAFGWSWIPKNIRSFHLTWEVHRMNFYDQ